MMQVSYNKLWKLLIDHGMRKIDLKTQAGISSTSLAKLSKNENVSMDVLKKICKALNCNIGDMMDIFPENCHENHKQNILPHSTGNKRILQK